jgi:hypothetical protein
MSIRELFSLWPTLLAMRTDYVVSRIVEIAEEDAAKPRNLNTPELKNLILRVARGKDGRVSLERLGRWLKRISGRTVLQRRLVRNTAGRLTAFRLEEV